MSANEKIRLLVIEDEEYDVMRIRNTIAPFGGHIEIVKIVSSGRDAILNVQDNPGAYDIAIMDYQLSDGGGGEELLKKIKAIDETLQIIIITKRTINQTNLYFANQLIESGAYWFGTKYPSDIEEFIYQPTDFLLCITNAFEKKKMLKEKNRSQQKMDKRISDILEKQPLLGECTEMQLLKKSIKTYAETNTTILILGESGVGKEIIASHIHYSSPRRMENFVTLNCAAIPKDLIESELFGFEPGAFSGADKGKPGLFEQADGGTILLDEIGELPMPAQAKLLRVLQEGEIDKIGRKRTYHVDVRVIASTNKNLRDLVKAGLFREDLFYRLNILPLQAPPLRERRADIILLFEHFVNYFSHDFGMLPPILSPEARDWILTYTWPGNVRQLKNFVQRIMLQRKEVIDLSLIESGFVGDEQKNNQFQVPNFSSEQQILTLKEMERQFRTEYIQFVLGQSANDKEAANKLGIAPPNFHRLCKELGLK